MNVSSWKHWWNGENAKIGMRKRENMNKPIVILKTAMETNGLLIVESQAKNTL